MVPVRTMLKIATPPVIRVQGFPVISERLVGFALFLPHTVNVQQEVHRKALDMK